MDSEDWSALTVRTRDGTVLGVVVGVFAEGLLAGRLRVHGESCHRSTSCTDAAVYAIPRSAVVQQMAPRPGPSHSDIRIVSVACDPST
jgi:hypothetical protein